MEKLELGNIHNNLVNLASINLYTRPDFRRKTQNIVGGWLINDRIKQMQHREITEVSEEARQQAWKEFNKEYEKAKSLIDDEASRYI
ncbi:MAG: hypothetical protein ABIH69_05425 [bacterium]